jgi:exopolysaccharide biosynthesis protein
LKGESGHVKGVFNMRGECINEIDVPGLYIINGEKVIEGSSGWGLQPRTVIGQTKNGVVMFLVVDGRQIGYSLGATMGDCADILEEYGAYNAGACDGGSSSVLAYNGEVINKPSTSMASTGRCLPNAWVVSKK